MMAMNQRHVSRWRRCDGEATAGSAPPPPPPVSLRYLDEFVRKLQCAPRLLEHQLFPDAKEITESMGLFNAVRRYVLDAEMDASVPANEPPSTAPALADGVIVVGDGNSPRTAAMFAFRLRHWKCYSIDPAMEKNSTPRSVGWEGIENLVVIRNKIENVRIRVRRAIVVLVHAHVALEQALSAVEAETVVGLVTMPCCNWYGQQERLWGRHPDLVYDDYSILSDHRELRVWIHPRAQEPNAANTTEATKDLVLDHSDVMMKGCVRKMYHPEGPVVKDPPVAGTSGDTPAKARRRSSCNVLAIAHGVLTHVDDDDNNPVALAPVAASIASKVPTIENVLVIDPRGELPRQLCAKGFKNVYVLSSDLMTESETAAVWTSTISKYEGSTQPRPVAVVRIVMEKPSNAMSSSVTPVEDGNAALQFRAVIENGFIFRGFRNQAKKTSGALFAQFVLLLKNLVITPSIETSSDLVRIVSISPRKDWRKAEFFGNADLNLTVTSSMIRGEKGDQLKRQTQLYLYECCVGAPRQSAVSAEPTNRAVDSSLESFADKERIFELKEILAGEFAAADHQNLLPSTIEIAQTIEKGKQVKVQGCITRLRRFTQGPSFVSLAPLHTAGGLVATTDFRHQLQLAVDRRVLSSWDDARLDAVLRMLHKGDEIEAIGMMDANAKGHPLLRLHGLRFIQSELQSYK